MGDQTLKKKRRRRRRRIILLVLIIIFVIIYYLLSQLSKPVSTGVSTGQVQNSPNVYNIDLTPIPITGHYVAFKYPKGLHLVSRKLNSTISVEDFNFYVKDLYSWTLAIEVSRLPAGELSQSSSYVLRKHNPQTYSESFATYGGMQVDIMTDKTAGLGFSKVAYLVRGDLLGTVSLIGNDSKGTQPLATTFAIVLSSWQWL